MAGEKGILGNNKKKGSLIILFGCLVKSLKQVWNTVYNSGKEGKNLCRSHNVCVWQVMKDKHFSM